MKELRQERSFLKCLKVIKKRKYAIEKMETALSFLLQGTVLPGKYKDHALSGSFKGCRECHIEDNWLLIYILTDDAVVLVATGTHDDLFK